MSDTIRDVQIRVSVVNGEMKLGPVDISSITDAIKSARTEWQGMLSGGGSTGGGSAGVSGGSSGVREAIRKSSTDAIRSAAAEVNEWYSSQHNVAESDIKIGRLGYAKSLRERAHRTAADEMDFAKRSGVSGGLDEHGLDQLRTQLEKRAASAIREKDRETAGSTADSIKVEKNRIAALKETHQAAIGAVKGLAQLTAAGDENSASMLKNIVAIEGLTNIAKNAGAALGTVGVGLAAIAAGIVATKMAYQEAYEISQQYWRSITQDAALAHERISSSAVRHHRQQSEVATQMPFMAGIDRALENDALRAERESKIRQVEANPDLTPERKAEFRARTEQRGRFEEMQKAADDEITFKKRQLDQLRAADAELIREQKNADAAGQNMISSAKKEVAHSTEESGLGTAYRHTYRAGHALSDMFGLNTGIDKNTGLFTEQMQAKEQAQERLKAAEKAAVEGVATAQNQIKQNKAEELRLTQDIANLETKRLSTTREIQQSAYEAVRNEKTRVTQGNISFGTADIGSQSIALRLQEKHERIEAQRAANKAGGVDEDEGVERYSPWELQQQTFGGIAGISVRRQAQKDAVKAGFKFESDLADKEKAFKAEMDKPVIDEQRGRVGAAQMDAGDAAREMAQAVKDAFRLEDLVARFKAEMQQLRQDIDAKQFLRQKTFGS